MNGPREAPSETDVVSPGGPALGVILAAGKGTRLMPFSSRFPKPLLPVLGRPLIEHQIEQLRAIGVERVLIVIGHLGAEIVRQLGDGGRLGVSIEYVEQGEALGIAHALARVEKWVDRPVMVLLGDIFFVHEGLDRMLDVLDEGADAVLAVKEETDVDAIRRNFVVIEDASGRISRVIEKPRHPRGRLKGCGVYLFKPEFFDSLRRTPRTAMRDEYELTDGIQIFIDDEYLVKAARVIREDLNLTHPEDLLALNLQLLGERSLVAPSATVAEGATIERSVVMDGAAIQYPIRLTESLVFPGGKVQSREDTRRQIVTPEHVVDCR
ncbi:MAG: sugar phosphate nucleotidyltransferase [Sandaracinaceae bacterium]